MTFRPLYYFSKLLFNVTIRTYYRDIKVRGEENLCPGKPVIIAMNHPNAFMDPIAFATVIGPEMNFLARGDAFTKLLTPILKGVGIIPIYRLIDSGREGVQKNDETFKTVTHYLKARRYVIIFAEGISLKGRRLNNLKKGCARIVLGAMENLSDDEIRVVPVGMNYQNDPSKFRHRIFINIGEPMLVRDYKERHAENPAKAINEFTCDLQDRMSKTIISISDKTNDEFIENIEEVYLEEYLESKGFIRRNLEAAHNFTLRLVGVVNEIHRNDSQKLLPFKTAVQDYVSELRTLQIRDKLLRKNFLYLSEPLSLSVRIILFFLGLPIWMIGLFTNYLPYYICAKAPKKITKDQEWYAAISGVVGSFVFLFYHSIQFIIIGLLFKDFYVLMLYVSITLFSGWFSLHFSPFRKKLLGSLRLFQLRKSPEKFQALLSRREQIVNQIKSLI